MHTESGASREFVRLVAASLVGAAALAAVGAVPTYRIAGQPGLIAMAVGIGVSFLGSIVAAVPIAYSRAPTPAARQTAFMGAIAARMFTTLILFGAIVMSHIVSNKPFALWTGVSYLVLLALETCLAIRLIRQREGPAQ
jgi:hypothetical protein